MTREEKIKVLAELDGWNGVHSNHNRVVGWPAPNHIGFLTEVPAYLTSYNAISPLIQKQSRATLVRVVLSFKGQNDVSRMVDWLQYTPEQLADALIRAVGKWRD